jgi:RsiW-degrading membrane proteinase PrsW (M82 family)
MSEIPHPHPPVAPVRAPSGPGFSPGPRLPRGSWLGVLAVGVGLFEALQQALIATGNPNLVPALIFVGSIAIPAAFVAFLYGRRLPYDVPGGVLAVTAVTGGVIGVVVAGTLEYATLRRLGTLPMITVALIEETAKLIIPVLLLLWHRYRLPADGLLIGVASGAGFAVLETMGYSFVTLILSHGDLSAVDGVLIFRGLLSPAAHMAWTGLAAAALWAAAASRWSRPAVIRFAVAFLLAIGLHTAWDSIGTVAAYIVVAVIGLAALAIIAHQLREPADRRASRAG